MEFGATPGASVEAGTHASKLLLFGRHVLAPRSSPEPFVQFATLACQTVIDEQGPGSRFVVPAESRLEYDPPADESNPSIRRLSLEFSDEPTDPEVEQASVVVDVPRQPPGETPARFFELGVALELGKDVIVTQTLNDVLDVPLLPVLLGLKMEWPNELDEHVPSDLALRATQGGKTRQIAWSDGVVQGSGRQFLFREILGSEAVTLEAQFGEENVVLFEQQDTSETEKITPTWKETLETSLFGVESGAVDFETIGELGPAKPLTERPGEDPDFGPLGDL
jgi:hypothetical protein